jgi:DNA-binding LytR/AlgR family response regulator
LFETHRNDQPDNSTVETLGPVLLRTLIVEDDPVHMLLVRSYVERLSMLQLVGAVGSAQEAEQALSSTPADLLLLDIGLQGDSGYDLLERLPKEPAVIVVTGDPGHALEGFEHGVVDLLVKPFAIDRFIEAVYRVQARIASLPRSQALLPPPPAEPSILLRSGRRKVLVVLDDILLVEAYGNHVKVHLRNERIVAGITMEGIMQELAGMDFMRVHRRYIVRCQAVQALEQGELITPVGAVPLGPSYRREVMEHLGRGTQAA